MRRALRGRLTGIAAVALALVPAWLTIPHYGITWDEPIYAEATSHVERWLETGTAGLTCGRIEAAWKTDPMHNVHPSGLKWLYVAAHKVVFWEHDPYRQTRVFSLTLFAVALGVFVRWWLPESIPGVPFTLVLLSMPRLFGHLHFAATDIPMTSCMLLLAAGLERLLMRRWFPLLGLLLGLGAAIKFTTLLLFGPLFVAYLIRFCGLWRTVVRRMAVVSVVGILTFVALNPDWWCQPIVAAREFLHQSTTRLRWTPISVVFAGRLYSVRAPWFYSYVVFAITTPFLHLLLLAGGAVKTACRRHTSPAVVPTLVMAGAPFVIMTLPLSPTNDGERYLLPAFPFLAVLMTDGLMAWWCLIRTPARGFRRIVRILGLATLVTLSVTTAVQLVLYHPHELSYYNEVVGGLRGAHERGFEVTYWWDPLNETALTEVNRITAGAKVYFPVLPTDIFFRHMERAGAIAFHLCYDLAEADYVLTMARPSAEFWEMRVSRDLGPHARLRPVWERSLDGVALLRLAAVERGGTGRPPEAAAD